MVKLAKRSKKNNISIDFVLFGDIDETNEKKIENFIKEVKGAEGSHMVTIPPSSQLLSDQLIATPIMMGSRAAGGSGPSGGDAGDGEEFPYGIDPSLDPELALALRMSMEEEKARQERVAREEAEKAKKESLEAVKEEGENEPLLDKNGQPSGSKKDDKGGKSDDADKMDTS